MKRTHKAIPNHDPSDWTIADQLKQELIANGKADAVERWEMIEARRLVERARQIDAESRRKAVEE